MALSPLLVPAQLIWIVQVTPTAIVFRPVLVVPPEAQLEQTVVEMVAGAMGRVAEPEAAEGVVGVRAGATAVQDQCPQTKVV